MGWHQHGKIFDDDGRPGGDGQLGKAASVRFVNPDLPGHRVTVYAYPYAPEKEIVTKSGSVETFHGFEPDMERFGVETQIWYEIDDRHSAESEDFDSWSADVSHGKLTNRGYSGPLYVVVREAEQDALAWVMRYVPEKERI